jgi:hypothetical protein
MRKSLLLSLNICAAATLTLALLIVAGAFSTGRAQATTSVKCKDGIVTVSTGDNSGQCVRKGLVINCGSGAGTNASRGGCDLNGRATCDSSTGSGSCTIAAGGGTTQQPNPQLQGKTGPITTTINPGLTGSSQGGSAATAGSKAKLPASGTSTQAK